MSLLRRPFQYRFNNIALIFILINAGIFVFYSVGSASMKRDLEIALPMIPAMVLEGNVWQLVTYMFFHADLSHLFFNMIGLFFFGVHIERYLGSKEFALFYLLCGALAGLISFIMFVLSGTYIVFLLGASGAIYAVLLAFAAFFPDERIYVMGIIPVRAPILVIIFTDRKSTRLNSSH